MSKMPYRLKILGGIAMKYKYLSLIALIPLLILSSTTPAFAAEKIEKIYVFPCTHADVGFDKPPSGIEEDQIKYLENATIIANARPEFYWMIETSRLMDSYLRADKPTDN